MTVRGETMTLREVAEFLGLSPLGVCGLLLGKELRHAEGTEKFWKADIVAYRRRRDEARREALSA